MATLTLSIITSPEVSVDLHVEPLHLARTLMNEAGASSAEIPEVGVETESGWVYDLEEIEEIEPRLTEALAALDAALAPEQSFNERQELRAALNLFRAARAQRSGVELGG